LRDVFIDGVGMVEFGKHPDKSLIDLMAIAAERAIKDSSTDVVEAIFVG